MAFFSERLFYVIIVLGLTITAIVVPIVILKQQPLAVTFFLIGPNGSGPIFITPSPPQKQEEFTTRLGMRAGMTTTEETNATSNMSGLARDIELGEKAAEMEFNASDFVKDYMGVDDMDRYFDNLVKNNQPYMEKSNYPNATLQGRDLMLIKIQAHEDTKIILIISGIGGGDWRSPLLSIFVMNYFLQSNESKTFLKTFSLHFMPLLNPDVYNWTRNAPPMNRSYQNNAAGVNLIRDYGTDNGPKKKQKPKQPETEHFLDYFKENQDRLRAIVLFEALPEELEGAIEMRICLPTLLKEKRNDSYNYFLHRYPGYQMCEEKDYFHMSNWVITQTPKKENPIITFSLQVNYKPDVFLDNLQFMLRYGQRFYEFLQDFLLVVKNEKAKDPLGMEKPKSHKKSKT